MGASVSFLKNAECEHVTRNKSHVPIFVVLGVSCVVLGSFRPVFVVELPVVCVLV